MTITPIERATFAAPAPTRLPGDLMSVAQMVSGPARWNELVGLMESYNCIDTGLAAVLPCPASLLAAPTSTTTSTTTTGGTLVPGTYKAIVTAINARGETTGSTELSRTVPAGTNTNTVTFNWTDLSGETGYKVYVTNGAANSEAQYVAVAANTATYQLIAYPPAGAVAGTVPTTNTAVVTVSKTFDSPDWQDAFALSHYTAAKCKSFDEIDESKVRAVFDATESRAIETALLTNRMVDGGSLNWDAATDLTPGSGVVSPEVGLAILEGHASSHYASTPTFHIPRTVASLLTKNQMIDTMGEQWKTQLGSLVAAGSGYEDNNSPAGATPSPGEYWLYASGQVTIQKSDPFTRTEQDRGTNEFLTLVEGLYVVTVDCYTAGVRVEVFA